MKTIPVQIVIVELENGRRGIFFGDPIVADQDDESDCQVEEVLFSNISQLPADMGFAEMARLAMAQFERQKRPFH